MTTSPTPPELEKANSTMCGTSATNRRDRLNRNITNAKSAFYLWWHGVFWKTLHLVGVARIYSVTMCRFNLYRRFPDGRCMWCGHGHN